jgi:hypothetical protein
VELWHLFVGIGGIGFLGWLGNRYFERRDKRRDTKRAECRAKIDAAIELIRRLESVSLQYFQLDATDRQCRDLEIRIKSMITQLSNDCLRLEKLLIGISACKLCRAYKKALTLNDFESSGRIARMGDDPLFTAISASARALEARLDREFERQCL